MNRKAWVLFAATSAIWGSSFLFIRVAVTDMARSVVVFGRCVLGALFLVPLARLMAQFCGACLLRNSSSRPPPLSGMAAGRSGAHKRGCRRTEARRQPGLKYVALLPPVPAAT